MKVAELITKLQALPQDMEVTVCRPASCCCGDCFLPLDDYSDPYLSKERPYGHGQDGNVEKVVL